MLNILRPVLLLELVEKWLVNKAIKFIVEGSIDITAQMPRFKTGS